MKKQTLLILFVVLTTSLVVNAQTIALHSSTGVQLFKGNTALALAYTAAQNGDTLYLSGGTFTPPTAIDKKLMIFGAGHYADSTLVTGKTFINGNVILSENADMLYLEGFEINGQLSSTYNNSINNLTIKRCRITGTTVFSGDLTTPSTNLALIGNVFMDNVSIANVTNAMITNNSFSAALQNTNGNQISNNIFLSGVYINYEYYVFNGNNNTFNNNIFIYSVNNALAASGSIGNFYYNNLFVSSSPNYGTTSTYIGNYTGIAQTAIFVSQTGNTFNYSHNYHLQNPETYLGTDATQVGIYGGAFPYKEGAVPLNPHIQSKNIATSTDANGDLQIQIQVKAQND